MARLLPRIAVAAALALALTGHARPAAAQTAASSATLVAPAHSLMPGDVVLVRNGCEFDHFAAPQQSPPFERKPGRPVVGYYGAIADWFDADLVADLAKRRPDWDFVLVGSTYTADTSR
ncbi:MAG: hypothetical protein KY453_04795, partial [Gemmatimonadetes bacterium]|nr:hypothetical protein [Gemmatimonadota bacterium]